MGLLDSVFNAVNTVAGGTTHPHHPVGGLAEVLGGMAGHGGLGGLAAIAASNPKVIQAALSLLGNDGVVGGLPGLIAKFQDAGLGAVLASWVGSGANEAISGNQIAQVLGDGPLSELASQLGIGTSEAAHHIAAVLPGLLDHLTPHGQPDGGSLGSSSDLAGILGRMLKA